MSGMRMTPTGRSPGVTASQGWHCQRLRGGTFNVSGVAASASRGWQRQRLRGRSVSDSGVTGSQGWHCLQCSFMVQFIYYNIGQQETEEYYHATQ